ncbi:uncharacterized protein LOC133315083 [Gastrolobium bilobum]|uniref:uncharacterized protein LOC133315083 n=1 Tax=Gastrolobium bilobum TaxID=150636 RepID=UPI002AAF764C|nr:uncharacterized protein LOC133315083 [Gastrolobium bilobum]
MGDSRIKGVEKKKMGYSPKSLPNELLVQIFAKVAFDSIADISNVKLSCKKCLETVKDNYVHKHASMDMLGLVPLAWFTDNKKYAFVQRCRESEKLEISYREGMVRYLSSWMPNLGLENLKKAAMEGHHEAIYVYSMLLVFCEDEEERK